MPSLQQHSFIEAVDRVFGGALGYLAKDDRVYEALYGFDRRAEPTPFVGGIANPATFPSQAGTAVAGRLQDSAERIKATFQANRVQAAIHYGEAWYATQSVPNLANLPDVASAIRASEHPDRIEIVFTVGHWPREFLTVTRVAVIHRPKSGPPVGKQVDISDPESIGVFAVSWVNDVLPPPHR